MSFPLNQIVCGDAFTVLKDFPEESIDMVMFSPPYWGLRDYKIPKVDDVFAVGGLGLESHPKLYIERMLVLCRLLKRVLKKSGSLWLNMGDTYFASSHGSGGPVENQGIVGAQAQHFEPLKVTDRSNWLQSKQKLLIPERVAIALQDDGWILRNDIVWHKPNHMPSSVQDRLTTSWEHLYFFVKSRRYYFDLDSIRQPHKIGSQSFNYRVRDSKRKFSEGCFQFKASDQEIKDYEGKFEGFAEDSEKSGSPRARMQREKLMRLEAEKKGYTQHSSSRLITGLHVKTQEEKCHPLGKNPSDTIGANYQGKWKDNEDYMNSLQQRINDNRALGIPHDLAICHSLGKNPDDFWSITTQPFKDAHFAVYPERLCEMPIKAGCPKDGTVLDPMCGSGTTCLVAWKIGRNYIGIELNPSYVKMAKKRLAKVQTKFRIDKTKLLDVAKQ